MMKHDKNTVRYKVAKRVILALCVTVVLLTTVNTIYMSRRVMQEQETALKIAADLVGAQISNSIKDMSDVTEGIANSLIGLQNIDEKTVKSIINQVALKHPDLYFVYFADKEGHIYMARGVQFATGVDPRERVWYKTAAARGHTVVIDPYMSATREGVMLSTVATPVYFGTELVGVVAVDADVETMNRYINEIDFQSGAYGFLIDSKGDIVVHKNEDFLPTPERLVNIAEAMPEIQSLVENPTYDPVVAKDYRNVSMMYCTSRLYDCNWIIGMAYPTSNIWHIIFRGIRIALFVAVVCIIVAAGDMMRAVKRILLPIEKINPIVDNIVNGDFSTSVDFEAGNDEIGALQNKLATMINNLTEVISTQKYILGEMEKGNLIVEDAPELPGELNEISNSVNSIKATFNDIISDIQFSAINLQSFAMGANETNDLEEMKSIFEELSAEANLLMEKTSKFTTMPKF